MLNATSAVDVNGNAGQGVVGGCCDSATVLAIWAKREAGLAAARAGAVRTCDSAQKVAHTCTCESMCSGLSMHNPGCRTLKSW